jgi:hypothetical protein
MIARAEALIATAHTHLLTRPGGGFANEISSSDRGSRRDRIRSPSQPVPGSGDHRRPIGSAHRRRSSAAAPSGSSAAAAPVTVDWWHITTGNPGKADFQAIADAYTAAHPNVTIKITVLENEAFKTKLSTTAAADYPDLFQSWGGGIMADQADAGLLKDITADIAGWKDTINPGALGIYATTASSTACRGTWA